MVVDGIRHERLPRKTLWDGGRESMKSYGLSRKDGSRGGKTNGFLKLEICFFWFLCFFMFFGGLNLESQK